MKAAPLPTPANRRYVRSVHLEAWLRNETPTDTASIALKGVIWAVSFGCLIVTLKSHDNEQSSRETRSRH